MLLEKAMDIINNPEKSKKGFMVAFDKIKTNTYLSGYFPDKDEEPLIEDEEHAWELARKFAESTSSKEYCNIYVVNRHHEPVSGYRTKMLKKSIITKVK